MEKHPMGWVVGGMVLAVFVGWCPPARGAESVGLTMELAQHLVGVTMPEPGVSRSVAVDVEGAMQLAEAA